MIIYMNEGRGGKCIHDALLKIKKEILNILGSWPERQIPLWGLCIRSPQTTTAAHLLFSHHLPLQKRAEFLTQWRQGDLKRCYWRWCLKSMYPRSPQLPPVGGHFISGEAVLQVSLSISWPLLSSQIKKRKTGHWKRGFIM